MQQYRLDLLIGNETIAPAQLFMLPDLSMVWSTIGAIASNIDEPGHLIRVSNEVGEILILVGVTTARRHLVVSPYKKAVGFTVTDSNVF
jgi:hypothetical protein